MLTEFEQQTACDRLDGWELVEFLQVPIEAVLAAAVEFDWIDDTNIEDVRDLIGVRKR